MGNLPWTLLGTCCGVGYVAISAFLAVVLLFLFVSVVSLVAEAIEGAGGRERGWRSPALG